MSESFLPQQRVFKCAHGDVAALVWGDRSLPCLVALHGWLDNAASFLQLAPLLSHYHVIALDLPGHGHSDPLPGGSGYYIWDYVEVVHQVVDQIGQPVVLLGHSMGGVSALLFSATFSECVQKVVLLDSLGPFGSTDHESPMQLRKGIEQSLRRARQEPGLSVVYASVEEAVSARLSVDSRLRADEIKSVVERNLRAVPGGFSWRTDPRLRDASKVRMTESMVRAYLACTTSPCLLLRAEHSIIPNDWFVQRSACLTTARLHTIPGHHHFHLQTDSLGAILSAMEGFLSECF